MSNGSPIRVLVVDDDPLVRSGLRMMLEGGDRVSVVGEAGDGSEVLAAVDRHRPDVVLMDLRMPGVDGLAATELLRAQPSPPEVLVLTTFDADEHVLRALRAGACGFLVKDTPPAEIVRAIELVAAGDGMLSPAVTRRLIAHVAGGTDTHARGDAARARLATLSDREREVAVAVGEGKANAEIATELFMSGARSWPTSRGCWPSSRSTTACRSPCWCRTPTGPSRPSGRGAPGGPRPQWAASREVAVE
jgi:DNA-binding NarL/FixJ family response regulator